MRAPISYAASKTSTNVLAPLAPIEAAVNPPAAGLDANDAIVMNTPFGTITYGDAQAEPPAGVNVIEIVLVALMLRMNNNHTVVAGRANATGPGLGTAKYES